MTPRIIGANLVVRLRSLSREPSAMFFTVAFPVILVLVFGAIFAKPELTDLDLPVQDLDRTPSSSQLVESLAAGGSLRTVPVPPEADAIRYARDNRLTLVLVIPRGYAALREQRLEQPTAGTAVALTYVCDPSSTTLTTRVQRLRAFVADANQRMSGAPAFFTLSERSILETPYRFIEFFVPGIIAMAVMTSSLSGALNMNAELRQKGILRKLATTPITRTDWLLSNILYQLILAAASTTAILAVSYAVFAVRLHINGWLAVYIVLAVFAFVGIGMALTPLAKEAESATAAANALLFPMMFLSGTFFPVDLMPAFLQTLARGLPLYYVNEGLRASMIFGDSAAAATGAAITGVFAVAVFAVGAVVTRWDREA